MHNLKLKIQCDCVVIAITLSKSLSFVSKYTYNTRMVFLRSQYFDIAEFNYFHTTTFRPLVRRRRHFLYRDEFAQTPRRLVEQEIGFLVVFAHHNCHFRWNR